MTVQTYWFVALLSAICFEGLGRKYLPAVPNLVFYLLKDVVLIAGYFVMRPPLEVRRAARWLLRGFGPVVIAGVVWTVLEIFNPDQESLPLGLIGIRAYWLWWIAPVLVATAVHHRKHKHRAIYALSFVSVVVVVLAAVQFASPPSSSVNLYSTVDGAEVYADVAVVTSTGRARVSSTFSFLSGFASFTILVPALMLSLGLEVRDKRLQKWSFVVTLMCAAVLPMSGSRGSVILGVLVLTITAWAAGLFFTTIGRRVIIGGIVAAILATAAFPEAFEGVQSRFAETEETSARVESAWVVLPPVALMAFDYPMMGIGTGMQQNARYTMNIFPRYAVEHEIGRYLVELGPVGFMLVWVARLGLAVGLVRAYALLKATGRRGAAGAALSYAALALLGSPVFDHVFQALFFLGCGFILSEVVAALSVRAPLPATTLAQEHVLT